MNSFRLLLGALAVLSGTAYAKIPEPDAIYYGQARHNGGTLVAPSSTGDIVVIARLNGVVVAQTALNAMSPAFMLKVPVDDGQEPRLTGTARGGERVRIYLKSISLNVEYEATQSSATNGLVVPTVRGNLTSGDLTVSGSLGGMAPGFAGFNSWATGFGLMPNPLIDSDGDGQSNIEEFAAGTDPTKGSERFQILEVRSANGVSSIKYGPVLLSREYSIWCSPTMAEDSWLKIGSIIPNAPADYRWFDHVVAPNTGHVFYKLSVDVR